MTLTWKAMKDGYNRTTGYITTLPSGERLVARNTGGRRSTGNWVVETSAYGPPTEGEVRLRSRGCSLRSVKDSAERYADERAAATAPTMLLQHKGESVHLMRVVPADAAARSLDILNADDSKAEDVSYSTAPMPQVGNVVKGHCMGKSFFEGEVLAVDKVDEEEPWAYTPSARVDVHWGNGDLVRQGPLSIPVTWLEIVR